MVILTPELPCRQTGEVLLSRLAQQCGGQASPVQTALGTLLIGYLFVCFVLLFVLFFFQSFYVTLSILELTL